MQNLTIKLISKPNNDSTQPNASKGLFTGIVIHIPREKYTHMKIKLLSLIATIPVTLLSGVGLTSAQQHKYN
ncbi:MAG: hypothetical protein H7240_03285 [Glaciimonas sp.]|nr:hypothetical protein [Glaciimonas sp.]